MLCEFIKKLDKKASFVGLFLYTQKRTKVAIKKLTYKFIGDIIVFNLLFYDYERNDINEKT